MKKYIIILSSFLLVLISISIIGYQVVSANEEVDETLNIINYQEELEKYFTSYGYTIDNPNIIINPYKISPLTALIIFETDNEEEVTIKVLGKDNNSTYTKKYTPSKIHYIEVLGLYPDYENTIIISYKNINKKFTIKTDPLPEYLEITKEDNNTNNLYFITTDKYPYALDNNNEVRWYLTENYSKKISRLDNNNLLLSTNKLIKDNIYTGLVEINLLGKIYKEYNINTGYYGTYKVLDNSILVLSKQVLEIDKQTGIIINENNKLLPYNNIDNKVLLPLYTENEYKLTECLIFNTETQTKESEEKILLINYKKIDNNYKKYNINITKESDKLEISGNFNKDDKVYIILDKFLNKKVYDLEPTDNTTYKYISGDNLNGKYSIYIKINDIIYKTNNYVKF